MRLLALLSPALASALLIAACGGDDTQSTDEIVSSRSVPTATLPAKLPTPLIVGSEGFRPPSELIGTIGGRGAYTIQPGDTFGAIAQKNGVTVQELLDANGMTTNTILRVGDKLIIPASISLAGPSGTSAPAASPSPRSTARAGSGQKYVVKPGDNASIIADQFGVTLQELARANNMTLEQIARLNVGQELNIP